MHINPLVGSNPYILLKNKTAFLVQKREKYTMQMREHCYICVFVEMTASILLQYRYGMFWSKDRGLCWIKIWKDEHVFYE